MNLNGILALAKGVAAQEDAAELVAASANEEEMQKLNQQVIEEQGE